MGDGAGVACDGGHAAKAGMNGARGALKWTTNFAMSVMFSIFESQVRDAAPGRMHVERVYLPNEAMSFLRASEAFVTLVSKHHLDFVVQGSVHVRVGHLDGYIDH